MAHKSILDISRAGLLIVDVQEAFRNVIPDFLSLASRIADATRGFRILGRPILVTEQYPKGLGRTAAEILDVLPSEFAVHEKTAFSSCGAAAVENELRSSGCDQIVVCGLETHICVNQTSHDLLDRGFEVHLLIDCVGSRNEINKQAGLSKMFGSGVIPSSLEMAFFEMMRDASHEDFKAIQRLVK
jgi:nicotinamidase-related amidase